MTTCGLCGQDVRFIGSHVLHEHAPYLASPLTITLALRAEREGRAAVASRGEDLIDEDIASLDIDENSDLDEEDYAL